MTSTLAAQEAAEAIANTVDPREFQWIIQAMCSLRRLVTVLLGILALGLVNAHAMAVIASRDTPAHKAALKFMRGVNFGNYLEYEAGSPPAVASYTVRDFQQAHSEGFDHIRLPVAWWLYCGPAPDYAISSSIFTKVDAMVGNATNNGLSIIVDLHHFYDFYANVSGFSNQFHAIWRQVAAHYASAPSSVAFELLNEPFNVAKTTVMNGIYAYVLPEIRKTNPNRTVFLGPGEYNSINELSKLALPDNDTNLIVTVHCYDPYYFTHQGAEWAYPDTSTVGVLFPGPPPTPLRPDPSIDHSYVLSWFADYNRLPTSSNPSSPNGSTISPSFVPLMRRAKNWSEFWGRPVAVGEFGCYYKADPVSRVNYHRSIRETMDSLGIGWTMWDWKAGFHYILNGVPEPSGMRQALFPQPLLAAGDKAGALIAPAALGKTFAIEKTFTLPTAWRSIATQMVVGTPQLTFTDPDTNRTGSYYRVRWLK